GNSSPDAANQDATKKFRLFQFNISCTNCEHIFRAAHFLSYRLRDKACLEDTTFAFGSTKHSVSLKEMVAKLAAIEPTLRGVSAHTLLRLYNRLVEDRGRLETFNATLAGGMTVDTMMTRLAAEMVELDDCIRKRETQQRANKDGAKRRQVMDDEEKVEYSNAAMLGQRIPLPCNAQEANTETQDERQTSSLTDVLATAVDPLAGSTITNELEETPTDLAICLDDN
ncbi:hypothetical protein DFQ26_000792, partial [Actinomortierella ambigua]